MNNIILSGSFLISVFINLNAQNETVHHFPDTLVPEPIEFRIYANLDSFPGDTVYHLDNPIIYVIHNYSEYHDTYWIALKSKKGYKVFESGIDGLADRASFDTINFNGTGNVELIARWSYSTGRSGWIDGWNENSSGICLWDIDKTAMIFQFQDRYEYNYWYTGAEFDSLGNLMEDSLGNVIMNDSFSGGESSCRNYDVEIQYRRITIERSPDCNVMYDQERETSEIDTTSGVYIWVKPNREKRKR